MEVRQLQIFRVLASELNFTRTAERVHTVQSNVTAQIKALEEELGVPLFDRLGRRVTLTDAGRRFLPFANQALAAMEEGERAIRDGSEPSGPLRIGAPESVLTYRLPSVVREYRRRYPRVELVFRPTFDATLSQMLQSGSLDIAIFMADKNMNPHLKGSRLRTERVFLVCDLRHPLVKQRTVKPEDLGGQNLLLTEAGCGYRAKLDRVLAMRNVRAGNITEFSSVEALKQCVAAGMGLGLLPAIVVAKEMRQHQLKVLPWAGPTLDIATHILWHEDKWVSPAMAAFSALMEEQLDEAEKAGPRLAIEGALARQS
ncbi:MAG TPA: LysR family transcriptional regulator [Acidobacteriaceae bacterium]